MATLFDYFPTNSQIIQVGDIKQQADHFLADIENRYNNLNVDPLRPLLAPSQLFLEINKLFSQFNDWPIIKLEKGVLPAGAGKFNANTEALPDVAIDSQLKSPFNKITAYVLEQKEQQGRIILMLNSAGRRETLLELLKQAQLKPTQHSSISDFILSNSDIGIVITSLEHSFRMLALVDNNSVPVTFITETELLGGRVSQRRKNKRTKNISTDALVRNLAELKIDQPIVHIEHGVGRYLGLQTIDAGGMASEFVTIAYASEAKLYVPVGNLHLLSRYSGGDSGNCPAELNLVQMLGNALVKKPLKK